MALVSGDDETLADEDVGGLDSLQALANALIAVRRILGTDCRELEWVVNGSAGFHCLPQVMTRATLNEDELLEHVIAVETLRRAVWFDDLNRELEKWTDEPESE